DAWQPQGQVQPRQADRSTGLPCAMPPATPGAIENSRSSRENLAPGVACPASCHVERACIRGTSLAPSIPARRDQSMAHAEVWWHRHWVRVTESVLAHTAAIVLGFVMMVVGLGLGVTIIMLPAGLVIGLLGATIFIAVLFARVGER